MNRLFGVFIIVITVLIFVYATIIACYPFMRQYEYCSLEDTVLHIHNSEIYHTEVIESIIDNYQHIIGDIKIDKIYLSHPYFIHTFLEGSFESYIYKKHPKLNNGRPYFAKKTYTINVTCYPKTLRKQLKARRKNTYYITHEIEDWLKPYKNVFALTPVFPRYMCMRLLPFAENKRKSHVPIFVIQGSIRRKDTDLLRIILNENDGSGGEYKIRILSKRKPPSDIISHERVKHVNTNSFVGFHSQFVDCYGIIPLVSFEKQKHYYVKKCTASINYARGYDLKCLIDSKLQDVYKLENVKVYEDKRDIGKKFGECLLDFYKHG